MSILAEKKEKRYLSDNVQLMSEWNWEKNSELGFDPNKLTCGSDKKVWWKCCKGHEWEATIGSRNRGCNCPYCAGMLVIKGENDLQTVNPNLTKEWNYDKNNGLTPTAVSPYSHKKIWWKCNSGHEWRASVAKRSIGQNCPFCSGKKAWPGYNDLSLTNPELISEWDFAKNKSSIYEYRPMSNRKVWWICDKGHSWSAVISKRVAGEKCPICQGKTILIGFNDLATTHPSLIQEWDYEKNHIAPTDISKGADTKVWWKCKRNHSWQAAVSSRSSGVGCPHCAKELQSSFPEKAIYFYIKKAFPDAIANYHPVQLNSLELDIFIPSLKIGIEYDGERWHQNIEKDLNKNKLCFESGIVLIRIREPSCPILLDELSVCIYRESKKSGLDKTIKQLFVSICETSKTECTTDIDLERDSTAILELLNPSEKENNILLLNPTLASEWDYEKNGNLLPDMITVGSDKKVWWKCGEGHSYFSSISSRMRGRGCPICSGKTIQKGYNDFASKCPDLLADWDYEKNSFSPDLIAYGSDKIVWWKCDKEHSYSTSINNKRAGAKCPFCSGKKVLKGFNDLATTHPILIEEWNHQKNVPTPTSVSAGSHKKAWWVCQKCGNEWEAPIYNRTAGHGCPKCAKEKRKKNK